MLLAWAGCSDDGDGGPAFPASCGLLTPEPRTDAGSVPEPFLLEGTELVRALETKERLSFALNNPRSVVDSFEAFKKAAMEAGFNVVGEDNEIFEAEIYLKRGTEVGSIQIRMSRCEDVTVVFVDIVQT